MKFRRILVATDFSPASRPAFRTALDLARAQRGRLTVVHVLPSVAPMGGEGSVGARMYEEMEASARQWAQKRLDRLVAEAQSVRVAARPLLLEGAAHEAIARAVRSERADVVVIGTHGRTGLERVFVGSVAASVLGTAPCPVRPVRPRRIRAR